MTASLVPTFDALAPQDMFEVVEDEKPRQIDHEADKPFHFFFIVDRSGSMGWSGRMPIAIEAMELFIRSLPFECTFSIISFGTRFEFLND